MFSIITPTYNRSQELPRVFNSLKKQTFADFEWIISDDGSTDETAALVSGWQNQYPDMIIIYHVLSHNQGKSYAVNEGLDFCTRPYTIIADSDDTFHADTLTELLTFWHGIEVSQNSNKIGAIWTLVENEHGQLVGEPWPKNFWQTNFKERVLQRKFPIAGEKWHSWRTDVLKEYKMYVHPNSFISEAATWNKINSEYDFLCVNVVHRSYWYTEDGLIHQKKQYKEIQKVNYYTTYYHLEKCRPGEILNTAHYRDIAFSYIRSSLYYRDNQLRIKGGKLLLTWLVFLWYFPKRALHKVLARNN